VNGSDMRPRSSYSWFEFWFGCENTCAESMIKFINARSEIGQESGPSAGVACETYVRIKRLGAAALHRPRSKLVK